MTSYLLDTHSFLWSISDIEKLGTQGYKILSDANIKIYISSITFWEISIKTAINKLKLENYALNELPIISQKMGFLPLPLEIEEAASFFQLPLPTKHKDPFDRMLIWQAISKKLTLISKDTQFQNYEKYGLKTIW